MGKQPFNIVKDIKDKIALNGYNFIVQLSISLVESGDYEVILKFLNLNEIELINLISLSKLKESIEITSVYISLEKLNITHIFVEKMSFNFSNMCFKCLSDNP